MRDETYNTHSITIQLGYLANDLQLLINEINIIIIIPPPVTVAVKFRATKYHSNINHFHAAVKQSQLVVPPMQICFSFPFCKLQLHQMKGSKIKKYRLVE